MSSLASGKRGSWSRPRPPLDDAPPWGYVSGMRESEPPDPPKTGPGRDRPGALTVADQPRTLNDLILNLVELKALAPVERARVIPDLIRACQTVLGLERGRAFAEATDRATEGYVTQAELAAELGIHRNKVADSIMIWRRSNSPQS